MQTRITPNTDTFYAVAKADESDIKRAYVGAQTIAFKVPFLIL